MSTQTATIGSDLGSSEPSQDTTATSWLSAKEIAAQPHWMLSLIFSSGIILINSWIAVSFIHHVVTSKVLKKKRSRKDVNGGLVMILAVVSVIAPFFRYFGTFYWLFVSLNPENEPGCETVYDLCVAAYGLAVMPTYCFLWARQRAFYGHPSLGHMFGTCVSVFSHTSLVLIVLTTSALLVLGTFPEEYEPRSEGCFLIGGNEKNEWRTYVYAFVMICSQLILLGLFLHPIRLHAQSQKGFNSQNTAKADVTELSTDALSSTGDYVTGKSVSRVDSATIVQMGNNNKSVIGSKYARSLSIPSNSHLKVIALNLEPYRRSSADPVVEERRASLSPSMARQGSKSPNLGIRASMAVSKFKKQVRRTRMRSRKVYGLIKRVLYLAIVSVISDLIVMVVNAFIVPEDVPQTYAFVLYDAALLINVITVILSFEKWRIMMMSPCRAKKTKRGGKSTENNRSSKEH